MENSVVKNKREPDTKLDPPKFFVISEGERTEAKNIAKLLQEKKKAKQSKKNKVN